MGESRLLFGETIQNLAKYLPDSRIAIITDEKVHSLYGIYFPADALPIIIGKGESNKTMQTLEYIFDRLIENDFDRSCFILGIGGGIVCDITGFAASVYLRGVKFAFVSSTLLAQVDASIGGKNGVNFRGYKNMIGTFNQPQFVLLDFTMLKTLDNDEYIAGYAEIIKHAAIRNKNMFEYLEKNVDKALAYDTEVIHRMVYDSLLIKSEVVQQDEKEETGLRRILNFGHTVGHAIEKITGIIHGQAVSIGMVAAARLSVRKGLLSEEEADRLTTLIRAFRLPVKSSVDIQQIVQVMKKDKKRDKDTINFVLLDGIGKTKIKSIHINQLEEMLHDLC